jgi:DNA-directed RNA polymerase II subunit RPB1
VNLEKLIFRLRLPDIEADEDNDEETVPMMLK